MMNYLEEYDETDPISIETYAKRLIGKTFADVCRQDDITKAMVVRETANYEVKHENKKRKGGLGELIEERFFHYQTNNDARPDFDKAGVELKVTPYKQNKNGTLVAKERLILTMIDYFSVVDETFENSHMWQKARLILLVYYLYQQEIKNRLDYRIGYVKLFAPPEQDIKIIAHDFEVIVEKIRNGKAHELSEGDTLYLGAAPKAATSRDRRKQPFSAESFEDYVVSKIDAYCDWSVTDLCNTFHIEYQKKPKSLEAMLAYRMLGIKGNHAEEFEKANVVVKTIRIEKNNKIKENMSFPTFKFKELVEEDWEDSTFGNYLRETRFLFVVYKFDQQDELRLKGCQFWNIPYDDLEGNVKAVWERTQRVLREGLQIEKRNGKNYNNFPKSSENPVCHVRPHAQNSKDTYELPDGRQYPKQCFWLNNSYILSQLDKNFIED